ncbi:MAG: PAS domain S-box protein [Spirochaetales bacterium]|nr:PAS domain S-box protein [Spirochaetales bacterium]
MTKKILLVEDEAIIAMNEILILEEAGFNVSHSLSGEEAVEIIKSDNEISLILMDIDLGKGIDGTLAANEILSLRNVPIIFLTSHNEKEMVDKVKDITKYGYIIKNSGKFVLIESINMAFTLFEANNALRKSEIENREIVESLNSAVLKFNQRGEIIYFSRSAERIFGYKEAEVLGKRSVDTINPEIDFEGNSHSDMMIDIFNSPEGYQLKENENRTKDGKRLWMKWYNKAVYDHDGNQMYILSVGEDITESLKNKERLLTSEKLFRDAFNFTPAIMTISRFSDGTYLKVNDHFIEATGYSRTDCIGKTSVEIGLLSAETRRRSISIIDRENPARQIELEFGCKSGKMLKCKYSGVLIEEDGELQLVSMAQVIE